MNENMFIVQFFMREFYILYGGILPYIFNFAEQKTLFLPRQGKYMFTDLYLYIIQWSTACFITIKPL